LVKPESIDQVRNRVLVATASGDTCSPSNVRSICLESTTGKPIQMSELQAYTASGLVVATGKNATQSSTFKDSNVKCGASNAVDGNNSTFSHTKDVSSIWEVDLADDYGISHTSIQNRWCGDISDSLGCLCRLTNATLSLLDSQGVVVLSVAVGNTCDTLIVKSDFEYASRLAVSESLLLHTQLIRIYCNHSCYLHFDFLRKK
jgi:hypothetical protein